MTYLAARRAADRRADDTSGSIGAAFALALAAVAIGIGLTVDYTIAARERSRLQQALDSAVLAGVGVAVSDRARLAGQLLDAHLSGGGAVVAERRWSSASSDSFSGAAAATVATSFSRILGVSSVTVHAEATALASASPAPCIHVLSPDAQQALLVNSGATINAPTCTVAAQSTASPAAVFNAGFTQNLRDICVRGANVIQNGGRSPICAPTARRRPTPTPAISRPSRSAPAQYKTPTTRGPTIFRRESIAGPSTSTVQDNSTSPPASTSCAAPAGT